jgi:hypothetical protein
MDVPFIPSLGAWGWENYSTLIRPFNSVLYVHPLRFSFTLQPVISIAVCRGEKLARKNLDVVMKE